MRLICAVILAAVSISTLIDAAAEWELRQESGGGEYPNLVGEEMSELAVVSIVVSLAVMLSQVMAVESAELQRLQGEAAAMVAENERAADPRAWDVAAVD